MALIDKASLLMVPSTYEDGTLYNVLPSGNKAPDETGNHNGYDQTRADFTFSRDGSGASKATRVNASGLIEKGRTNLLTYSNDFSTTWTNARSSETSGQSGYDGTNDAWLFTDTTDNGTHLLYKAISNSGVITYSIYAKANTLNWFELSSYSGGTTINSFFDLENGVVGSGTNIEAKMEAVSGADGWYRCSVTGHTSSANAYVRVSLADADNSLTFTGTGSGSIYIQDAQLEKGLVATDYIETTTAAASAGLLGDMPRLDYSGGASSASLLLEPQRTNLIPYSEFTSGYLKNDVTWTYNDAESPEGVDNALKSTFSGTGYLGDNVPVTAGTAYTFSVYLKGDANKSCRIYIDGNGSGGYFFTQNQILLDGTWTRYELTYTIPAGATNANFIIQNSSWGGNTGVTELYSYGLQIEAGSYPTSYIPTYGTAVARAADSGTGAGNSDVINNTEGTLYAEIQGYADSLSGNTFLSIKDSTGNNRLIIGQASTANQVRFYIDVDAYGSGFNYAVTDITQPQKLAIVYSNSGNNISLYLNGVRKAAFATSDTFSATLNEVVFNNGAGTQAAEFNVKELIVFNEALTQSEAEALTTL